MTKIAIITGGPSLERGISLNSARSFLDHIDPLGIEITLLYVDAKLNYYQLTRAQIYSNTPSDFDFKLSHIAKPLEEEALVLLLKKMDLVFPLVHGVYGEDGVLQSFLEKNGIPFAGSSSQVCRSVFNKNECRKQLTAAGFPILPYLRITSTTSLEPFWKEHQLKRAVIKPALSGSSIGVTEVFSLGEANEAVLKLFEEGFDELLLEPFCEEMEFTVCVLESHEGKPMSLIPLEIETSGILTYSKKYMPSVKTRYYCPPRFSEQLSEEIRREAEKLFEVLGLRDFARIDGWVSAEGKIYFSDLNPISGMEQNSFIFQQAARAGLSHLEMIQYILENALKRSQSSYKLTYLPIKMENAQKVFVLMGGVSSERQVSLMSGTNVWMKLKHSPQHEPILFLLDEEERVWQLPYAFALNHTIEEMREHCQEAEEVIRKSLPMVVEIRERLGLSPLLLVEKPIKLSLEQFIQRAKQDEAFVFIALHGGRGEDGTLQKQLEEARVSYNGCNSTASVICMDKYLTSKVIKALEDPHILSMPQFSFNAFDDSKSVWEKGVVQLGTSDLIIKPQCDGCSTGVVRLRSYEDFKAYLEALERGGKYQNVDMPVDIHQPFLLEPYIQVDRIQIAGKELVRKPISGWCEMTIGVLEKEKSYQAFHPSITVAESHVLSVEEKFQGGTGINITPPPEDLLPKDVLKKVQKSVCRVAEALSIKDYARIDLFVECATGNIQVIEANTLPALTPSTVIYHQAFCESPPLNPRQFLSKIIDQANRRDVLDS
jgi:D-alanine--D-alanine ligase